jgi:hypothetical protein
MDFYQKNPTTLRRLLTKRQNPSTQIFKPQSSNSTNGPMSAINLPRNDLSMMQEERSSNFIIQNSSPIIIPPTNFSQSQSETAPSMQVIFSDVSSPNGDDNDEDGEPHDNIQKKVKTSDVTTGGLNPIRKTSYEEEKEVSEHSTSCETRSEFNMATEPMDFLLSPSMNHQYSSYPSDQKMSENEDFLKGGNFFHNPSSEEAWNLKKAQEIAQQIGENFSTMNFLPDQKLKLKCKLNHQSEMNLGTMTRKSCSRCADLLSECKEFARKNDGTCLNLEYDEVIQYRCAKGHIWSLNHKNARRRWCAQCAKEHRAFLKKKCEDEKVSREKEEEESQKRLFEEARKKAMSNNSQQSFNFAGIKSGQKTINTLEYFQKIDYEIESLAKKYTLEFMSQKQFGGDISYQQILQVYKIMIMPEEIFQSYMFNLNADTLRSEFRRMAKIIHPDKNKHPQAGNAFQKIYKVYEVALSRLEGTQKKI